jgi:hypothetical protein
MKRAGASRRMQRTLLIWFGVSFAVWNGFFDILITRGEQYYLLSQARHELGIGPKPTIDEVMSRTIRGAARVATIWAVIVFVAGVAITAAAARGDPGR